MASFHVLGIDAGGTKTVGILADDAGTILGQGRGPGANLHLSGEHAAERVLHDVMEASIRSAIVDGHGCGGKIQPAAICLGIAGVDREDELKTIHAIMRRIGYKAKIVVVNDALVALTAGAYDAPGIVVIAGTGAIVYGRNTRGEAARAGGWGHMIGDEGSGYWIGKEALAAVMRQADGRGPETNLTTEILAHFDVADISRLPRIVYDRAQPRMAVAALGPLVQRVAEEGDAVAHRILERAAEELVLAARSVANQLEMRGDAFSFYLAGGIFPVVPWLGYELARRLIEVAPRSQVELLEKEPAEGAVWLAIAEARGGASLPKYKV